MVAAVRLENADRMMTYAEAREAGIEVLFADGKRGIVPYSEIPEIGGPANLDQIELPNPFEILLRSRDGKSVDLPWDFVRHYCDQSYRPRMEGLARDGRQSLGARIRRLRKAAGMTQEQLASVAGLGRVTLVRIEKGDRSPKYDTLFALARAMGRDPAELSRPLDRRGLAGARRRARGSSTVDLKATVAQRRGCLAARPADAGDGAGVTGACGRSPRAHGPRPGPRRCGDGDRRHPQNE